MVGIARGRGCDTCRKRKISCGLEKPMCAHCVKSKRVCTGYRKYPIFISHQSWNIDATSQNKANTIEKFTCKQTPCAKSAQDRYQDCTDLTNEIYQLATRGVNCSLTTVDPNPALRQCLFENFLDNHLSKSWLSSKKHTFWIEHIPFIPQLTKSLEISTTALCLAKLGELYNDRGLAHESLKMYNQALHQLQRALLNPELMLHDQTLTTCLALGMYELSQCPNQTKHAYISHTLGCQRLVQLRGPEAHADGLGHALFLHFRIQGIVYALDQGEQTFLSDPVWQDIPWRKVPKTPYEQAYDFLMEAPELRNQGDKLAFMDRHSQLHVAAEMIRKCWRLDAGLQDLYDNLESSHEGPLFWSELARNNLLHGDSEDGILFPVAFHFPNLHVANTIFIIWARSHYPMERNVAALPSCRRPKAVFFHGCPN